MKMRSAVFWVITQRRGTGRIGCPETSVQIYNCALRNIPEQRSDKSFLPRPAASYLSMTYLVNSMETVKTPLCCFRYLRHHFTKRDALVNLNTTSAASTYHQGPFCEGSNQWSEARRDMCTHDPQLLVPTRKHCTFLSPGRSVRNVTG